MYFSVRRVITFVCLASGLVNCASGQQTSMDQLAVDAIKHPDSLQLSLWADSSQLANPVAFHIDEQGVMYICETFRQNEGVEDNRGHMDWLDDDLAAQTLADRLKYFQKHLGEDITKYEEKEDRITRLVDSDADGKADQYGVFADGFNDVLAGTGAGVLAHQGDVFYTCIPDVWKLNDTNNDGQADEQVSLHYGYGVRVAFRGHDLHGLVVGPDGRLYFSIGDRGYSITTAEGKKLHDPASGAVFRCELDGSQLEVFATGLRNPQELAFDDFGNLFTGDNNSDGGDQARLVHVVRGGDTGWRMYYQYLGDRGPWNREKLWHPKHAGQPAYLVPPICNFGDGPSGLTYYPGTGFGDKYKNTFFLCDFRGDAAMSGIRSFRFDPSGATFTLADADQFLWNVLATDVDFGPDGSMYLTDWIEGWNGLNRGRVIRVTDPQEAERSRQVATLLRRDTSQAKVGQLLKQLAHPDRRVRFKAQFELARRDATHLLKKRAQGNQVMAKLHATWGLGQIARTSKSAKKQSQAFQAILGLTKDSSPTIRKAALQMLDDVPQKEAVPAFTRALEDQDTSVRATAAIGISRYPAENVTRSIVKLLTDNDDRDPVLRHAGIMALAGTCDADELVALRSDDSEAVRRAAVVALRRQRAPQIAQFLADADNSIVTEAALAIHDVPILPAFPQLAALVSSDLRKNAALTHRVLNANFRLAGEANAEAIASVLGRPDVPPAMQLEALDMLDHWQTPSNRDRVLGDWRPLDARSAEPARVAIRKSIAAISKLESDVAIEAIRVAAGMGLTEAADVAGEMILNDTYPAEKRARLLLPLADLRPAQAASLANMALRDKSEEVRAAARDLLIKVDTNRAIEESTKAISTGSIFEQQAAFAGLARMEQESADAALRDLAESKLLTGGLPREVRLDAVEAIKKRGLNAAIQSYLDELKARPYGAAHLATYGGNADRGREVFSNNVALSCTRCHKAGRDGGRVGPNLAGLGASKSREYLLESIVDPNKVIAEGFGTLVVITEDGLQKQGVLQKETDEHVQLVDAEGKQFLVMKDQIIDRQNGKSAMPEDLTKDLSLFDLRDLVAFLHSLKTPWKDPAGHD